MSPFARQVLALIVLLLAGARDPICALTSRLAEAHDHDGHSHPATDPHLHDHDHEHGHGHEHGEPEPPAEHPGHECECTAADAFQDARATGAGMSDEAGTFVGRFESPGFAAPRLAIRARAPKDQEDRPPPRLQPIVLCCLIR